MSVVTKIYPGAAFRPDIIEGLEDLEEKMMEAISAAKRAGVPQGLICAILRAHEYTQVKIMVDGNE